MDKSALVELLVDLNTRNEGQSDKNTTEDIWKKITNEFGNSQSTLLVEEIFFNEKRTDSPEWKYLIANVLILELLNNELSKSELELLSVQETKNVKLALQNLVLQTISKNLQPNLPCYCAPDNKCETIDDILFRYSLLKSTVIALHKCIKLSNLRMLIIPHCLRVLLVALFQLGYCPLKKPQKSGMSEEIYSQLLNDQQIFKEILDDMNRNIHPTIFIKETMIIFQSNSPIWFKKSVSNLLTKILRSKKGIQNIASAMLDGTDDDTTKTWQILDILTKLIMSCRKLPDFTDNICTQILNLVKTTEHELIFERLVVSCTKSLYSEDKELCKLVFIQRIMSPLLYFTSKEHEFHDDQDITDNLKQTVRLIHGCFVDNSSLPINLLKKIIAVVFYLYHLMTTKALKTTNKELEDILIKFLKSSTNDEIHFLLDSFLFGFSVDEVAQFRNDVLLEISEKIVIKKSPHSVIYATFDVINTVIKLFPNDRKVILFSYLLKCISNKEKYLLSCQNSRDLLGVEQDGGGAIFERLLTIHKLLTQLSEDKQVQKSLTNDPSDIIHYIKSVIISDLISSEQVFINVMILDNLVSNATRKSLSCYQILLEPLEKLSQKTTSIELKCLCEKVVDRLRLNKFDDVKVDLEGSEFQKALEDICDPLLPTRGHALLTLAKLIEKKDKEAMERKQYLLNLFQLHLKDEDSYIYLSAVQGLAALADIFTDSVLETLCEEFSDFSKKVDGAQETRLKLGEVLVRVVKLLGEMAPKYKSLLLNTFLSGTRDDDHLIRSSSLSNLGEVCKVLNYKLGTIVTEVLVCVHAIITTDKAVEARRAAVTVIRQLFVGLQSEMIAFLKEDILQIYRTLKEIYHNDKDDVMRLQAQLALEELNENVKSFVLPNPQLHSEKKIIMLD